MNRFLYPHFCFTRARCLPSPPPHLSLPDSRHADNQNLNPTILGVSHFTLCHQLMQKKLQTEQCCLLTLLTSSSALISPCSSCDASPFSKLNTWAPANSAIKSSSEHSTDHPSWLWRSVQLFYLCKWMDHTGSCRRSSRYPVLPIQPILWCKSIEQESTILPSQWLRSRSALTK